MIFLCSVCFKCTLYYETMMRVKLSALCWLICTYWSIFSALGCPIMIPFETQETGLDCAFRLYFLHPDPRNILVWGICEENWFRCPFVVWHSFVLFNSFFFPGHSFKFEYSSHIPYMVTQLLILGTSDSDFLSNTIFLTKH